MKAPKSKMELAEAIEALIGSYLDGIRESAREALERAMPGKAARGGPGRRKQGADGARRMNRRATSRLDELCNTLYEVVRANPGSSMVTIAEMMDAKSADLQWPITKLQRLGRVRRVGQRSLARYYPAVLRSAAKD
jgi:hypothetical protein